MSAQDKSLLDAIWWLTGVFAFGTALTFVTILIRIAFESRRGDPAWFLRWNWRDFGFDHWVPNKYSLLKEYRRHVVQVGWLTYGWRDETTKTEGWNTRG